MPGSPPKPDTPLVSALAYVYARQQVEAAGRAPLEPELHGVVLHPAAAEGGVDALELRDTDGGQPG